MGDGSTSCNLRLMPPPMQINCGGKDGKEVPVPFRLCLYFAVSASRDAKVYLSFLQNRELADSLGEGQERERSSDFDVTSPFCICIAPGTNSERRRKQGDRAA